MYHLLPPGLSFDQKCEAGRPVKFCCELLNLLYSSGGRYAAILSQGYREGFFDSPLSARSGFHLERDCTGSSYSGQKEEEDDEEKGDVARLS